MVRVSAIPYLNTVPFVYGLKQKVVAEHIELSFAIPAISAHKLLNDQCDLAIVPVAAVPSLPHYEIIGKQCIGAVSAVASVLLCSRVPVEQIREVALDGESGTSVLLARLLLRDYWQISPRYLPLSSSFSHESLSASGLSTSTSCPESAVLIGDKAMLMKDRYPYVYDLAEYWIAFTGKPFVFAAWVANKKLPDGFADIFEEALAYGVAHIDEAVDREADNLFPKELAKNYLANNISFSLDEEKYEGLRLFWSMIKTINTDRLW